MASSPDPAVHIKRILSSYPKGIGITELSRKAHIHRNVAAKYLEILRVSGEVEMQKIGMAKIYSLSNAGAPENFLLLKKELEEKEQQYRQDIRFLSGKAEEFANLTPGTNIYEEIGKGMEILVPHAVISVSSFDPGTQSLTVRAYLGDTDGVFLKYYPMTVGLNMPISDTQVLQKMASGVLMDIPGGIHVVSLDRIPVYQAVDIEEALSVRRIYSIGLASRDLILGSMVTIKRDDQPIGNPDIINAYGRLSTLALRRWLSAEKV